jgi:zinc/manganese transport system substrate-binding protein
VSRRRSTAVPTALALLLLAGCSGDGGSDTGAAVSSADADACPGNVADVVVSVGQWGDVVREVAGDCATATTIVSSGAVDPHDFEPGTADLAAFSDADLVVVNGADYDSWAEDAVATLDPEPAVLAAGDLVDQPSRDADPHLWYEPAVVQAMGPAVGDALAELSPDAAAYVEERVAAWQAGLGPYLDAVAELGSTASGRTYAATEPVFDRMAGAAGLVDATPQGYRRAASNGSDPSPGDLAAFDAALADGSIDVLVYNTQTSGSVPEQLRSAAEEAGVPVVEVTESPADDAGSFVAWQVAQLSALSDALSGTR